MIRRPSSKSIDKKEKINIKPIMKKNETGKLIENQDTLDEAINTSKLINISENKLMAKRTEIDDILREYQLPEEKRIELENSKSIINNSLKGLSKSNKYINAFISNQGGIHMAYDNQCGSCVYFESNGDSKGYCSYIKSYYYPGDKICTHYSKGNSGCYITTIVCDLMGLKDNCGILETLRGFRNNVMQKDPKYKETLYEYDIVGPQIAKYLMEDYGKSEDKEEIIGLFNFFILPTVRYINEKNYPEAVDRYTKLTEALIDKYGIERVQEVPNDYDYTNGGHGVKKLGTYGGVKNDKE